MILIDDMIFGVLAGKYVLQTRNQESSDDANMYVKISFYKTICKKYYTYSLIIISGTLLY